MKCLRKLWGTCIGFDQLMRLWAIVWHVIRSTSSQLSFYFTSPFRQITLRNGMIESKNSFANPAAKKDINIQDLMDEKQWKQARKETYKYHDKFGTIREQFLKRAGMTKHEAGSQALNQEHFKGKQKIPLSYGELIADNLSVDEKNLATAFTNGKMYLSDSVLVIENDNKDNSRQLMLDCLKKVNNEVYNQLKCKTLFLANSRLIQKKPDVKSTSLDRSVISELKVMPWSQFNSKTNCRCRKILHLENKYCSMTGDTLEEAPKPKLYPLWCEGCFNMDGENSTCQIVGRIAWHYVITPNNVDAMNNIMEQSRKKNKHYDLTMYEVKVGLKLVELIPHDCICGAPLMKREAWSFSKLKVSDGSDAIGYSKIEDFPCDLLMAEEGRKLASVCDNWTPQQNRLLPAMDILNGKTNLPGDDERLHVKLPCPTGIGALWDREASWKFLLRAFVLSAVMSGCVDEWTVLQRKNSSNPSSLMEDPHMNVMFLQLLVHGLPKRKVKSNGVMETIEEAMKTQVRTHQNLHCDFNYCRIGKEDYLVDNNPRLTSKSVWPGTTLFPMQDYRDFLVKNRKKSTMVDGDDVGTATVSTKRGQAFALNGAVCHAGKIYGNEEGKSPHLAGHIMQGSTLHPCNTNSLVLDMDSSLSSTFLNVSHVKPETLVKCFEDKLAHDLDAFVNLHVKKDGSADATLLKAIRDKLSDVGAILDEEQARVDDRLQKEMEEEAAKQLKLNKKRKDGFMHELAESQKKAAIANPLRNERARQREKQKESQGGIHA